MYNLRVSHKKIFLGWGKNMSKGVEGFPKLKKISKCSLGNRLSYRSHFLTQDQGHQDAFKNAIKFGGGSAPVGDFKGAKPP